MNFLAHISLSGSNPKVMVGNFIGDFVKGKNLHDQFEPDIVRGIELHRAIDEFTDNHPIVALSKDRLRPTYRHYAAVIVDMYYDHLLAYNWNDYYDIPLTEFAERTYRVTEQFDTILPENFRYMFGFMRKGNWLLNYGKLEGIHRALSGMASRSKYKSKMEFAVNDLKEHYDAFTTEFSSFFPLLQDYAAQWLTERESRK